MFLLKNNNTYSNMYIEKSLGRIKNLISYKSRMKFKEHFKILVDVAHFVHKKRTIQNEEISIEEIWMEYANEYLINNEEYI